MQRDTIEHSVYQRNDVDNDGNDSEVVDEQVDSVSASGRETPDDDSVKAPENGFANSLNLVDGENACSTSDADAAQKLKENVWDKKDANDMRNKVVPSVKTDKKIEKLGKN